MRAGHGVSAWATRPLAECGRILSGGTPSKAVNANWNGTIPWISAKGLKSFQVTDSEDRITEIGAAQGSKIVPKGSVLFVVRGMSLANEFRVGVAGRAVAFNQDVRALVPHDDVIPEFLAHYLRASEKSVLDLVDAASHGTARLTSDRIEALPIPLPPLAEQRRIAEVLDQADALRAKRRAALAQVDGLTQAIFLEMFGDPVRNPRSWAKAAFGELCDTRLGRMLDQKQQTGLYKRPYLRNANVRWFEFDLSDVYEMDFDPSVRETMRLEDGDLLICEGGEPGRAAVWRGEIQECYFQKALHRARPDTSRTNAVFLSWLFWFLAHDGGLRDHVTSATIAHLTREKLKAMPVPVPPLPLQRDFARRAAAVGELKAAHRAHLTQLDALFASLQHRAFRGEL